MLVISIFNLQNSDSSKTCLDSLTSDLRTVTKKMYLIEKLHIYLKKTLTLYYTFLSNM